MVDSLKSLAVFIHFSASTEIPYYVKVYLREIGLFFDEVIFVTNNTAVNSSNLDLSTGVEVLTVKNEGYDLGMFFKVIQQIEPEKYLRIACINDSNVLFKELLATFSWSEKNAFDFWGVIDSLEKPWFSTHSDNYHIQSHFMVFEAKAIPFLISYLENLDVKQLFSLTDKKELRRKVINKWEIGLTQYFLSQGIAVGSRFQAKKLAAKWNLNPKKNFAIRYFPQLAKEGYPLLKKKLIVKQPLFEKIFGLQPKWKKWLINFGSPNCEIPKIIEDLESRKF
jgi:lipopolysaccharide biosynthesis protein